MSSSAKIAMATASPSPRYSRATFHPNSPNSSVSATSLTIGAEIRNEKVTPSGTPAWRVSLLSAFAAALARYHTAAQLVGQGGGALDARGRAALTRTVQAQLGFLDKWALEIQDKAAYTLGRQARAALYAQGIGASYWRGATKMLPLPAMPRTAIFLTSFWL